MNLRIVRRGLLLLVGIVLLRSAPLSAQLLAAGVRNLSYGAVFMGIPKTISPSDPVNSGQFDVQAPLGTRLRLDFVLPTQLVGPAGATMPVTFLNNDALLIETAPGSVPQNQNPKSMKPYTMTFGNRLFIFLGGGVTPGASQATGAYSNTVTLTVTII